MTKLLFILLLLFGCDDYCNDEDACNYDYSSGKGLELENCIYPTQNSNGFYSGNLSFGERWGLDSSNYAYYSDTLRTSGITMHYDCSGNCLIDSDGDGVCDFMDDNFESGVVISVINDIMESNNINGSPLDFGSQEWIYGQLKTLNLSNLDLEVIPSSIGDLENLESLILSYNDIISIPDEIGHLNNLQTLKLDWNQLTSLPNTICDLPYQSSKNFQFNNLCNEHHYDCIQMFGGQDQSNCCEGPNGEPNWTTCN
tara:strand:- start:178 stop:942 length:765 start_codon:yes stop_codon:yes gene_type:complete